METIITMIILTGMAVLFLSNIFRQVKDERERVEQRRAGLPRRPATSTEQFLEEVNRRRQQATERGKSSLPPIRPPAARSGRGALVPAPPPIRRETTARKAPARLDRPRQTSAPSRPTPASRVSQLLEVVPADKPADRSRQAFVVPKMAEAGPTESPVDETRAPASKVSTRPMPVLLAQLMPLLRSRQTLRAAFMLHEILGPPRCHHRRVQS